MRPTSTTIDIAPDAIYDDDGASHTLGISRATLARARREGELRYSRRGGRIYYLGDWLLRWLLGEDDR